MMKRWFVVHTRPNGEQRALVNLERQDFAAWLPVYAKHRRHARRVETVHRPLFPRYLFVSVDLEAERWRAILSTYGVAGLVGAGDGPEPVPDGIVEALQARADADGSFILHRTHQIHPGDSVRVAAGPMRDLEGIFHAATGSERVVVLLSLMGRHVRVTVSASDIEAV